MLNFIGIEKQIKYLTNRAFLDKYSYVFSTLNIDINVITTTTIVDWMYLMLSTIVSILFIEIDGFRIQK